MKPIPRLFLDASVWIAAAGSTTGGSALILDLCHRRKSIAVCSRLVLLEAERNIERKLDREALLRFYEKIASLEIDLVDPPSRQEIIAVEPIIGPKDAHVLAAAHKANIQFLLTLDRKHFLIPKVLHSGLSFQIATPGDFVKLWLNQQAQP